ncbi:DUF6020 family protein [Caproicibacterium sp. BJN0003]|uniref:DUF6020 family protein n=1 Tax=Caproicibacterium sp. BJN0003 TaxID=2994078 RepID=UPI00159A3D88|nr:DUF6020 family protein [Caproicibacterium sp. BJN0003]UZT82623.1 DUF6020 family protein [Caproicibacterium sp. BJN0003]CAB1246821.1 conserved membrane protein of unknown function [Ruminococcaceae bacterium BL-4]
MKLHLNKLASNKQIIMSIIFATIATWGIQNMIKGELTLLSYSNSIFSWIWFVILMFLWYKTLEIDNSNALAIRILLALFFSASLVFGSIIIKSGYAQANKGQTWVAIISGTFLWYPLITIALKSISKINLNLQVFKEPKCITKLSEKFPILFEIIVWIIIFLSWVPNLIASFPGIYGYDSVYQINFYINHRFSLHHPIIHSYLLGFFTITVGDAIGNRQIGFLLYILIQMAILSFAFAETIRNLRNWHLPFIVQLVMLLLFMFLPTNSIMSFSSTKDIIYSATFLLMVLQWAKLVVNNKYLESKKSVALTIVIVFINLIFRNNAIYVNIMAMIIGLLIFHKWKINKKILSIGIISCVLFGVYSGPITALAGGVKSDSLQEMLSVPIMQLSRAATVGSPQLNSEDISEIAEYIPDYSKYTNNQQGISDLMKQTFNSDLCKSDPKRFIALWIKVGKKCPTSYVDAFLRLTIGLWYPDMNYRDPQAYHPYWEYDNTSQNNKNWVLITRQTPTSFQWLEKWLHNLSYNNNYQSMPIFSMLFSSGFFVWNMLLYITYAFYKHSYQLLFPAAFLFALWLTLLLGPVVLYRYIYPLVITTPVLLGLILKNEQNILKLGDD